MSRKSLSGSVEPKETISLCINHRRNGILGDVYLVSKVEIIAIAAFFSAKVQFWAVIQG
jgi:hypothetical protein